MRKIPAKNGGTITLAEKGDVLNPKGRPKKLVSSLIAQSKAEGYEAVTPSNIRDAFEVALNWPEAKIKEIGEDKEAPIVLRLVCIELAKASKGKATEILTFMLDRSHGKVQNNEKDNTPTTVVIKFDDDAGGMKLKTEKNEFEETEL